MITSERQPTGQTLMPALAERLGHGCATRTGLRCARRVDSQHHATSVFRFVSQDLQEAAPCGIRNGLGQYAASHALNVQVFDKDDAVALNQCARHFVMKIPACIVDMRMRSLQDLNRLAATFRTPFASGYTPLS